MNRQFENLEDLIGEIMSDYEYRKWIKVVGDEDRFYDRFDNEYEKCEHPYRFDIRIEGSLVASCEDEKDGPIDGPVVNIRVGRTYSTEEVMLVLNENTLQLSITAVPLD